MSRSSVPLRGQVFRIDVEGAGPLHCLVISNNQRNARLGDVLVVTLTNTPPSSARTSYVSLEKAQDPFEGWVNCDGIVRLRRDLLGPVKGALSPGTMRRVDAGLAFALSLPRPA
jgi:mRNA-degrading endonuclease toxin of MazEF toxin-antitoxin module